MSLLDFFNTPEARFGMGLLAAAGPRPLGQSGLGDRLMSVMEGLDKRKEREMELEQLKQANALRQMQMDDLLKAKAQERTNLAALRGAFSPMSGGQAMANGQGPTVANAQNIGRIPKFDPAQFMAQHPGVDMVGVNQAVQMNQLLNPERKITTLGPGQQAFDGRTGEVLFSTPDKPEKPEKLPSSVQEYQFALGQGYKGSFQQWTLENNKSKAPTTSVTVDNKMGASVAGEVGPILRDSSIRASGAVKMFDSADRIEKALDSGLVTAGPMASKIQTVKQFVQMWTGGNADGIRQTRQVIKSLAQMSVEARKQLQGQGQVTENEARAVAKADAGELDDLTVEELRDLATLTKRAAHFSATAHQGMLSGLNEKDGTLKLLPFYKVQGLETLLNYKPVLPQIGTDIHSQADAILRGK